MPRGFVAIVAGVVLVGGAVPAVAQSYHSHTEIGQLLLDAQTNYPSICQRYNLGSSYQGRELWAVCISDNVGVEEDEPEFKYISTMHGDEIMGVEMCLNLVNELLTLYGSDPQITTLVDEIEIWIVPLMNPDGYMSSPRSRYSAQGVDLNRNFPEGSGPSPDPNTTTGRAVETQVIMNWSFGRSFSLSANFHGGALVANYPYDNDAMGSVYSPTPDDDMFIFISEEYSRYNLPMWNNPSFPNGITNGADWYAISGGMQDWSYRYMGCNEITVEVSNSKQPPASQIPAFWSDNRDSMLAYLATCLIGVRGLVTDGQSGLPLACTITVAGREDHQVYTDPDVGDYQRMLLPGTYDLTFVADGYDPHIEQGVVVNSGDATRLDVQFWSGPQVSYPNGGEVLDPGVPIDVTWVGNPASQFHVQYTDNYGDLGGVTDDFEGPDLGPDYVSGGNRLWFVTNQEAHSGLQSARAGNISHNQVSWMTRTASEGQLSFWYRVSSEASFDFFNFYIDGGRLLHESGPGAWTLYSTALGPGNHELKWEYTKDITVSYGSDTVWIDELQIATDNTVWTDIIALTPPGTFSTPWTPLGSGSEHKVRVRAYTGGSYGPWDESDSTFAVGGVTADGDYNNDQDVDLDDYGAFQRCLGQSAPQDCLDAFDFDVNTDVDLVDYGVLETLFDGPGPP